MRFLKNIPLQCIRSFNFLKLKSKTESVVQPIWCHQHSDRTDQSGCLRPPIITVLKEYIKESQFSTNPKDAHRYLKDLESEAVIDDTIENESISSQIQGNTDDDIPSIHQISQLEENSDRQIDIDVQSLLIDYEQQEDKSQRQDPTIPQYLKDLNLTKKHLIIQYEQCTEDIIDPKYLLTKCASNKKQEIDLGFCLYQPCPSGRRTDVYIKFQELMKDTDFQSLLKDPNLSQDFCIQQIQENQFFIGAVKYGFMQQSSKNKRYSILPGFFFELKKKQSLQNIGWISQDHITIAIQEQNTINNTILVPIKQLHTHSNFSVQIQLKQENIVLISANHLIWAIQILLGSTLQITEQFDEVSYYFYEKILYPIAQDITENQEIMKTSIKNVADQIQTYQYKCKQCEFQGEAKEMVKHIQDNQQSPHTHAIQKIENNTLEDHILQLYKCMCCKKKFWTHDQILNHQSESKCRFQEYILLQIDLKRKIEMQLQTLHDLYKNCDQNTSHTEDDERQNHEILFQTQLSHNYFINQQQFINNDIPTYEMHTYGNKDTLNQQISINGYQVRSLHEFFSNGIKFISGDNDFDNIGEQLRFYEEMPCEKYGSQHQHLEYILKNNTIDKLLEQKNIEYDPDRKLSIHEIDSIQEHKYFIGMLPYGYVEFSQDYGLIEILPGWLIKQNIKLNNSVHDVIQSNQIRIAIRIPNHSMVLIVDLSAIKIKNFFEIEICISEQVITINLAHNLIWFIKLLYSIKNKSKLKNNMPGSDFYLHTKRYPKYCFDQHSSLFQNVISFNGKDSIQRQNFSNIYRCLDCNAKAETEQICEHIQKTIGNHRAEIIHNDFFSESTIAIYQCDRCKDILQSCKDVQIHVEKCRQKTTNEKDEHLFILITCDIKEILRCKQEQLETIMRQKIDGLQFQRVEYIPKPKIRVKINEQKQKYERSMPIFSESDIEKYSKERFKNPNVQLLDLYPDDKKKYSINKKIRDITKDSITEENCLVCLDNILSSFRTESEKHEIRDNNVINDAEKIKQIKKGNMYKNNTNNRSKKLAQHYRFKKSIQNLQKLISTAFQHLTTEQKKLIAINLKIEPQMQHIIINDITNQITNSATEITYEDVQHEFRQLSTGSAPGPSGLDKDHFNFPRRADQEYLLKFLVKCFNVLIKQPERIIEVSALFQYRSLFIEKPGKPGNYRHISMQETSLNLFHKVILNKIKKQLHPKQFAMQKHAQFKSIKHATKMNQNGFLLKLDIQKAFDSVPFEILFQVMRQNDIPHDIIKYILNFAELRFSSAMGQNKCGIPQGDPLSMFLFCLVIDPILNKFEKEYKLEFIAYADDILVYIQDENLIDQTIKIAQSEFSKIGLTINQDKCQSTLNGGIVDHMGIQFSKEQQNHPLAPKLLKKCQETIKEYKQHLENGANTCMILHYIMKMLIPAVNYGAFFDESNQKSKYLEIDHEIATFIQELLKIQNAPIEQIINFCVLPKHQSGLQLLLPGHFFDMMQTVNKYDDETGFEEYHKKREFYIEKNDFGIADSNFAIYAIMAPYMMLENDQLDYAMQQIIEHSDTQFKKQKIKMPPDITNTTVCPLCKSCINDKDHNLKCHKNQGLYIAQHDLNCKTVMKCVKKDIQVGYCQTEAQLKSTFNTYGHVDEDDLTRDDTTKKRADFMLDDQACDFTQVDNNRLNEAYNLKLKKYGTIYGKEVLPVVVSHGICIHEKSLHQLKGFVNINRLRANLAYRLIVGNLQRIKQYHEICQTNIDITMQKYQENIDNIKPISNEKMRSFENKEQIAAVQRQQKEQSKPEPEINIDNSENEELNKQKDNKVPSVNHKSNIGQNVVDDVESSHEDSQF
uniref:RT/endonuclease n=1 Tax=Trepomonas sp. PC1 TaxID=1076344 RepID=A0A146KFN7_9EUKA|eukprot:JAP95523.1 RT/endonuclease [Trepomonas sp. PC1]